MVNSTCTDCSGTVLIGDAEGAHGVIDSGAQGRPSPSPSPKPDSDPDSDSDPYQVSSSTPGACAEAVTSRTSVHSSTSRVTFLCI
eukprot:scaffold55958_cov45-Phaeocystis_antarctica.AAC.2